MKAWVAACCLLAFVACKDSEDVFSDNRTKAQTRLAEMRSAIVEARENPAIRYNAREPLRFTDDRPNAALVEAAWFVDGDQKDALMSRGGDVISIQDGLRGQGIVREPKVYEAMFERFYGLEFLVVIDLTIFGGVPSSDGTFVGGTANGHVHVIDIKAKKSLAGIPISVGSSGTETVTDEAQNLRGDVTVRARAAVNDALNVWLAVGEKPPLP